MTSSRNADGSNGLQIINISNPSNPTLTGTYNTSGVAQDVAVRGNSSGVYVYCDLYAQYFVVISEQANI